MSSEEPIQLKTAADRRRQRQRAEKAKDREEDPPRVDPRQLQVTEEFMADVEHLASQRATEIDHSFNRFAGISPINPQPVSGKALLVAYMKYNNKRVATLEVLVGKALARLNQHHIAVHDLHAEFTASMGSLHNEAPEDPGPGA